MMLSTREWYYTYGLNHTIGTLLVGATVVYTRDQITDYLQAIQDYKVGFIQVVPTTIRDLVNSNLKNYDLSSLLCMMSTSTPIDADLVKTAKEKFPKLKQVSQMYGMTEAGCLCDDLNTPKGPKPGSVGCVNPGVVDIKGGKPLGPNETGEICFKTPSLMPAYVIIIIISSHYVPTEELGAYPKLEVSFIQVVPTTIRDLVNSNLNNYDVSSLLCMMSTSTPIDADLVKTAKEKFPKLKQVSQMYGMTEAGCLCDDLNTPKGPKPGSVGCVNPGVVDIKTGEPLGPNETGEICFKTPSLMPGYLGDLSRHYLDGEGFFKSGDIGYYDEDLYFYITHRIKDIIKYKGATVSPNEIEAVLLQYPGVREVCVVAIEHRQYGEVPAAAVIADDVTAEELITFVAEQLTSISMDGGIKFVDNLPKVEGVKLNRKAVKDLFDI
ncbi:Luciferin 4-monooxygenase [Papilio machaon]|uniref:Luciferin 4-monooxygenase n=1 Tax=Papilio machaon TaxID=76193 RepID=A0A0N1IIT6_PAPMA|nr:Luciferin 4-monooxygenase [Papilio machaon]